MSTGTAETAEVAGPAGAAKRNVSSVHRPIAPNTSMPAACAQNIVNTETMAATTTTLAKALRKRNP